MTRIQTGKFPSDEKRKKIVTTGNSARWSGLVGQRPMTGRKGKNNEDHAITIVGSGSRRGDEFEHRVSSRRAAA
jgi:hypothetical protein